MKPREAAPPGSRAGHWLAFGLLVPAGVGVGWSVARALPARVPLTALLGPGYHVWLALLAAACVAVLVSAQAELRAALRGGPGRGWFPFRAAVTSCVAGAGAFLFVFPRFDQVWFDLAVGLVGGAFAALLLATRRNGRPQRRAWRGLDFILFNLCLTLLFAELGLRVASRVTPSPYLAQPAAGPWQYVLRQMLPPRSLWWGFRTNSEGHYDEEFGPRSEGQPLVATIGDSFSVGTVHHSLHFTTVAEEACGVRVDNYGAPAIGPREYLDILRLWVAPREPDLLVVNLFVGNDIYVFREAGSHGLSRLGSWLDRTNVLTVQVPVRMLRAETALVDRNYEIQPNTEVETREQLLAVNPWVADPGLERPSFEATNYLTMETSRVREIAIQGDCEGLFDVLRQIRAAAGEIPFTVMLIPDEFQVEDPLWEALVELTPAFEAVERDRPQRLIGAFLAAEGIPYLDLLPALRAVPPMEDGRRHLYHLRDTHFNARGNQVAGAALGEFLRTELGL